MLLETPSQTLNLADYSAENRQDLTQFFDRSLPQNHVTFNREFDRASWIETAVNASEGNFAYASQMLPHWLSPSPQIGSENISISAELAAFYQQHWQQMLPLPPHPENPLRCAILRVLVQHSQPLSIAEIAGAIDPDEYDPGEYDADEYDVEAILDEWVEFLDGSDSEGETLYRLYHKGFRQWCDRQLDTL